MGRYSNAVAVITLVILLPLVLGSAYAFLSGALTYDALHGIWKEPLLLLIGFWIRGASQWTS